MESLKTELYNVQQLLGGQLEEFRKNRPELKTRDCKLQWLHTLKSVTFTPSLLNIEDFFGKICFYPITKSIPKMVGENIYTVDIELEPLHEIQLECQLVQFCAWTN